MPRLQLLCLCRAGAAGDEEDFKFARRSDGKLKEVKGALGGSCVVSSAKEQRKVMRMIKAVSAREPSSCAPCT